MGYPTQYRYTKEHEWIELDGKRAKVGITDHAQSELGDVVFVELPAVGTAISRGDTLGTVESVKAVSDVYSPLSGVVVEVNSELEASPETINADPHSVGWLVVLEVSDSSELDALLDAAAYEKLIAEE
ncbi:MAG: glycine cleavage system protein GcvH [Candidatus Bipolaricaulota bacterium]|nr:glycine cleavage system protein GcvH [Candidatus Bipolaricaulota bacterium]